LWVLLAGALLLMGAGKSCSDDAELGAVLRFDTDTVAIGRPFTAQASVVYAREFGLIMPDSAKGYAPFELVRIDTIRRGMVRDTIVEDDKKRSYVILADSLQLTLRTFSLDSVQRLRLRYRLIDSTVTPPDTHWAVSSTDSVRLNACWPRVPPASAQPQFDFGLNQIREPFDWQGLFVLLALLGMLGSAAAWALQRPIRRYLARRALDTAWAAQQAELSRLEGLIETDAKASLAGINALWRAHFQSELFVRLSALTTAELADALAATPLAPDSPILVALSRAEDRAVYAGLAADAASVRADLSRLREILATDTARRREAIARS
jgi:hypothetical protein